MKRRNRGRKSRKREKNRTDEGRTGNVARLSVEKVAVRAKVLRPRTTTGSSPRRRGTPIERRSLNRVDYREHNDTREKQGEEIREFLSRDSRWRREEIFQESGIDGTVDFNLPLFVRPFFSQIGTGDRLGVNKGTDAKRDRTIRT